MKFKNGILILLLTVYISMGLSFAADNNTTNNTTDEPILLSSSAGVITELTAVGSPYSTAGDIQFICTTTNEGPRNNIPASTCNLTIRYGPNNEFVKSIEYDVPTLRKDESYTYTWNTTNVDFPYNSFQTGGSYEITAIWTYSGGSDSRTTTFYSVPSPWAFIFIVGILIAFGSIYFKGKRK